MENIYLEILKEIEEKGKIMPQYVRNGCQRYTGLATTGFCSMTFCLPCLFWDSCCCVVDKCCCIQGKNPVRWGCGFEFIKLAIDECCNDKRNNILMTIKSKDVTQESMVKVCTAYLSAYDKVSDDGKKKE